MTYSEINNRINNTPDLSGTTGNERLFLSGLLEEFDYCKVHDKDKARYILEELGFDKKSIAEILTS